MTPKNPKVLLLMMFWAIVLLVLFWATTISARAAVVGSFLIENGPMLALHDTRNAVCEGNEFDVFVLSAPNVVLLHGCWRPLGDNIQLRWEAGVDLLAIEDVEWGESTKRNKRLDKYHPRAPI